MLKGILYLFIVLIAIWALDSININSIFKKNKYYQSRVTYLMFVISISYLVTNFFYDFFINTKFI